jgi:hypothetical protein
VDSERGVIFPILLQLQPSKQKWLPACAGMTSNEEADAGNLDTCQSERRQALEQPKTKQDLSKPGT